MSILDKAVEFTSLAHKILFTTIDHYLLGVFLR